MASAELVSSQGIDRSPPRIPARRYPLVSTFGSFDYEVRKVTRENLWSLRDRVLPFENEFGYPSSFTVHQKVIRLIREGGEVVFARTRDHHPKDVGVVTQELRRTSVDGQPVRVLSVGIRVVLPEYQSHRIATNLAAEGILRHNPDAVTGQTRVWGIPRMYQDTGLISSIPPIDGSITPKMQEVLRGVLDRSVIAVTDLRTGLCLGVYPPGGGRSFIPRDINARGVAIYKRIREIGADPEKGDGIRYYAVVDKEAVEAGIAKGYTVPEPTASVGLRPTARLFIRKIANFLTSLRQR